MGLLLICTKKKNVKKNVESVNNDLFGLCKRIDYIWNYFINFHFSLRLVDISDEILNSDVEMSNNENEDKNVIVSEVKAVPTAKKSNNKESKV